MRSKSCGLLLWLTFLHAVGTLIFLSGFLLKRTVLSNVSSGQDGTVEQRAVPQQRYRRAVLLVIDALRFDFVEMDFNSDPEHLLPFQNKMPVIEDTLKGSPKNSRLYKFVADPPTTTMQRLKGLTTGGLPTFVDAGSNFDSAAINEDNWLLQASRAGRKLYFMGDDTWMQLFPDSFSKKWPFPSLNVKDLHTVDNGVLHHLLPELQHGEWDVLIAHFLGVDHCGHRFGPYHPAIGKKLQQMNDVIRDVIPVLDEDTVLFVFGDHGMTRSGDHGGDSTLETSSALFVYSPTALGESTDVQEGYGSVSQIDLVPSLSLLLGLPIPFNNLGQIIPDLFSADASSSLPAGAVQAPALAAGSEELLVALMENARQVNSYLQAYSAVSADLPASALLSLSKQFQALKRNFTSPLVRNKSGLVESLQVYLADAQTLCRQVWAKFNVPRMLFGLVHLFMAAAATLLVAISTQHHQRGIDPYRWLSLRLFRSRAVLGTCTTSLLLYCFCLWYYGELEFLYWASSLVLVSSIALCVGVLTECFSRNKSLSSALHTSQPVVNGIACVCLLIHSISFLSNSFLVQEDDILLALGQLLSVTLFFILYKSPCTDSDRELASPASSSGLFYLVTSLVVCRLATFFRGCREEQAWCVPSTFLLHSSTSFAHNGFFPGLVRLILSCAVVIIVPLVVLAKLVPSSFPHRRLLAGSLLAAAAGVCGHFCVQSLPLALLDSLAYWQHVFFPRLAFVSVLITVVLESFRGQQQHTSGFHVILVAVWLIVSMLLGDGLVFAACLLLVEVFVAGNLLSANKPTAAFPMATLWAILSGQFFFATGHQYDLPSLRFDAAFVGLHGDQDSFIIAGALVVTNMFASQILFTLGLTLVMAATCKGVDGKEGIHQQVLNSPALVFYFLLYHSLALTAAATAATVLRRHLMVWKIFAPRLLYASANMQLVCFMLCLVVLLSPLTKYQNLSKKSEPP